MKTITIQFEQYQQLPIIALRIRGKIMKFLIDTGAVKSIFSSELVGNRQIKGHGTAMGIGGEEKMPVYHATFRLLGASLNDLAVSNQFGTGKNNLGGGLVHGLLGQDFLSQFSSYTIDNQKQRITFNNE